MSRIGPYQAMERAQNEKANKKSNPGELYEDVEAEELRLARQRQVDAVSKTPPLLPEGVEGPPETARFEEELLDADEIFPPGFRNTSASTLYVRTEQHPPKFYTHGVFVFDEPTTSHARTDEEPFHPIDEQMLRRQRATMEAMRYDTMNAPTRAVATVAKYLKLGRQSSTEDPDPFSPREQPAPEPAAPAPPRAKRSNVVHPMPVPAEEEAEQAQGPQEPVTTQRNSRTCTVM